ncbi:M20 metallopeptidase family protein [Flavobacterium piscinae]|uniref:M20 metallopeptidase family protein n=1 Tax=Flavobacterium piscinae TaxID=2506424 RepID=UPI002AAA7CA0|nr:M20/M25/M40 family metallo-hydrolase [Flavobacterium piscinae]
MKLSYHLTLILLLSSVILGCKTSQEKNIHQKIENDTEEIFDKLVEIRRDFHQNPEIAGDESRSSKIIAEYLINLGLEVKTGIAGNGVIGILKGKKEGKIIAWRADMDALPHDFPDEVSYKSKNKGIQHGCGHDIHMAIGLGIAEVLSKNKEAINGTVYFIFQPEEETFVGAKTW